MSSCGNPVVDGEEALMQVRPKFDRSINCIKCKIERGNIVIRHAVYCKNCFFPLVSVKFRRCLDPYINASSESSRRTALKASGDLLVGFSGGLGSTVLLDILTRTYFPSSNSDVGSSKGGKSHPRNKKVWMKAYACYVETCGAFPEGQMRDRSADVRRFFDKNNDFEYISARIEDAFDSNWWAKIRGQPSTSTLSTSLGMEDLSLLFENLSTQGSSISETPISLLRAYLSSLPTPTAIQSAITSLTRLILVHTANHLKCSHLALGTSLTSYSISLINAIAQGDGFHIPEESFEEWRDPLSIGSDQNEERSVRIVRPLRDVGMKECAAWAYWKGLSIVGREALPGFTVKRTIGGLTKNFIVGLEKDYPSTVSTIARTCGKLAPKAETSGRCALCERSTPAGVLEWKARISIRSLNEEEEHTEQPPFTTEGPASTHTNSLAPHLCYACHTLLTSKSPRSAAPGTAPVHLPQWTNALLALDPTMSSHSGADDASRDEVWSATSLSREKMKDVVGDFLLET